MQERFDKLNQYSLDTDLFLKYNGQKENNMKISTVNIEHKKRENNRYIVPKQKDKLFWCFYILHYGIDEYKQISSHFAVEKKIKLDFVNTIRENKTLLKFYSLKRSEVENQLVNENKIEKNVFLLLCIYHDINVLLLNKNFYYENECNNDEEKTNIISYINNDYCIDTETKNIDFYRLNCCKMDNLNRFVKPMSGYKLQELQNICIKLNINIEKANSKHKTKTDLYTDILSLIES